MGGGLPHHALLVEYAQDRSGNAAAFELAAEEQILGDRHRGGDSEILVNGLDAGAASIDRALEVNRVAIEANLALVGNERAGEGLDQRRLAGAVVADHGEDLGGA